MRREEILNGIVKESNHCVAPFDRSVFSEILGRRTCLLVFDTLHKSERDYLSCVDYVCDRYSFVRDRRSYVCLCRYSIDLSAPVNGYYRARTIVAFPSSAVASRLWRVVWNQFDLPF